MIICVGEGFGVPAARASILPLARADDPCGAAGRYSRSAIGKVTVMTAAVLAEPVPTERTAQSPAS
jgi:hypothetical protein